jgi:hypothetical protein
MRALTSYAVCSLLRASMSDKAQKSRKLHLFFCYLSFYLSRAPRARFFFPCFFYFRLQLFLASPMKSFVNCTHRAPANKKSTLINNLQLPALAFFSRKMCAPGQWDV